MTTRNGKIARLPVYVRDRLNERLELSEPGPRLLEWLNALPEVKEVVQKDFASVPISKQNLSEWRQGGFEEWLARRELREDAEDMTQLVEEMEESSEFVLADAAATVLAARFGSLLANWNGEVDEKFEAKSRVLNRLCRSVVQLQRGMHHAIRESFEIERLTEEKEKAEEEELKKRLVKPCYDMLKTPILARLLGGGTVGLKMAEYVQAVRRGNLEADLDLQPDDKYEYEEKAEEKGESVKPAQKGRTPKQAGKTKPQDAAKPLEENEMSGGDEDEFSQDQSSPVKPSQTDLQPITTIPSSTPISTTNAPENSLLQPLTAYHP